MNAVGTLIENVNAIAIDEEANDDVTTARPNTPEPLQVTNNDVLIENSNTSNSFDSISVDDLNEDYNGSATDPNILQDVGASVLQDADIQDTTTADLQDTDTANLQDADTTDLQDCISQDTNPHVLQVADTHDLEEATIPQDIITADIHVKDPQLGTVETLYDACTLDNSSLTDSSEKSGACHTLDADISSSCSSDEDITPPNPHNPGDGSDYVVEVYL